MIEFYDDPQLEPADGELFCDVCGELTPLEEVEIVEDLGAVCQGCADAAEDMGIEDNCVCCDDCPGGCCLVGGEECDMAYEYHDDDDDDDDPCVGCEHQGCCYLYSSCEDCPCDYCEKGLC